MYKETLSGKRRMKKYSRGMEKMSLVYILLVVMVLMLSYGCEYWKF